MLRCGSFLGVPVILCADSSVHDSPMRSGLRPLTRPDDSPASSPLRPLMELMETSPQILQLMRVYALGVLARSAQSGANELPRSFDSYGMPEDEEWLNNGHRSRDFQPLQPDELASMTATWRSFRAWLWGSISPRVPPGCRHGSNPLSGSLAQAQVKAKTVTGLIGLRQSSAQLDSRTGRQPLLGSSTEITRV